MEIEAGTRVGPYRVVERLGSGAMGEVFSAVDEAIDRPVALKVMRGAYAGASRSRLEREAKSANRVKHPGAVDVLALGELPDGRPYLVLPLLEGRTFRAELEARGKLPLGEAWALVRAAAEVLAAASRAGVIHRDVKPENLFLETGGRVRVLDFGLARLGAAEGASAQSSLSAGGAALGTPAYMPPEQWWNEGVDARSDQYALAATFFELVTGAPPFGAGDVTKLLEAHLHAEPPTFDAGQGWIDTALAKSREDRFVDWDAFVREGDHAFARAVGETPRARGGLATAPLALGVAAATLGIWLALGYAGEAGRNPREWLHIGGWGAIFAAFWGAVGIALAVRAARVPDGKLPWIVIGFAAFSGASGTYTGWEKVLETVTAHAPEERLAIFHEGSYEASASRFVGMVFASAASLALAVALSGSRLAVRAPLRAYAAGAVAFAMFVGVALPLRVSSAIASSAVGAMAVAVLPLGPLSTVERPAKATRALACVLATVFAIVASLSRVEAKASAVFAMSLTRAERIEELARVAKDRSATLATGLVALCAVLIFALQSLRRHGREGERVRRATVISLAAFALAVAVDQGLAARFAAHRSALQSAVAAQLGVFSRVTPPSAFGDAGPPHRAAGVVVSNQLVAIDGKPVAPIAALSTQEGVQNLARDVAHAIAAHAEEKTEAAPDVSIAIDRDTRWSFAAWVLTACRRGGARRVELLFTRGEEPKLRALAEDATYVVMPEDFVALSFGLAEVGREFSPEDSYRDVALQLWMAAERGQVLAAP